jgi:hypothetical protein
MRNNDKNNDNDNDLGPRHHLSRLMTPELDPTTQARSEPLGRLWPAAIIGTLVLAALNARGLENWAARLPESAVSNAVISGAQTWTEWMERRVFDALQKAFQDFRKS